MSETSISFRFYAFKDIFRQLVLFFLGWNVKRKSLNDSVTMPINQPCFWYILQTNFHAAMKVNRPERRRPWVIWCAHKRLLWVNFALVSFCSKTDLYFDVLRIGSLTIELFDVVEAKWPNRRVVHTDFSRKIGPGILCGLNPNHLRQSPKSRNWGMKNGLLFLLNVVSPCCYQNFPFSTHDLGQVTCKVINGQ